MSKHAPRSADFWVCCALVVLTLALYWQVTSFEFTNFDDDFYVYNNPAVQAGVGPQTVRWAMTTRYAANWHPLTWISLMADTDASKIAEWVIDSSIGPHNSGFYHLTNAVLHAANAVLLFLLLNLMTRRRWPSAFVAALFAVHPLHVESVAWVAERKDVLSTLFWLLTTLAYVRHVKTPGPRTWLWVLVLFALGLMAKPMLVTLPLTLILLDLWPLGKSQITDLKSQMDKLSLFVLALVSCGLTVWAQGSGGAMGDAIRYPIGVRLANAAVAVFAYLWKMTWPADLSFLYLHPGTSLPVWQVIASAIGLIVVTVLALRAARNKPYITVGWLWYLITLLPVVGLVQVGKQAMADRYTYVPLIGIFIIVAWGLPDLMGLKPAKPSPARVFILGVLGFAAIAALTVSAHHQIGYWQSSLTLFPRAIQLDPTNSLAYNNLGNALLDDGQAADAEANFRKALKHHPEYLDARYNLAGALREQGKTAEAIATYKQVLKEYPGHINALNNLGSMYAIQGNLPEAIKYFEAVLKLDPSNESTQQNLQNARDQLGLP